MSLNRGPHAQTVDHIAEGVPKSDQMMEVMEHVLHHVTDMGLGPSLPSSWGIVPPSAEWCRSLEHKEVAFEPWGEAQESELHDMMVLACEAGQYSIRGYAKGIGPGVDIPGPGYHVGSSDPELCHRVMVQE